MLRNTTLRLSLIYTVLFTISVLAILALVYWYSVAFLMSQTDSVINADVKALAERYQRYGVRGLRTLLDSRVRRGLPTSSEIYLLVDPTYTPVAGNLNRWPAPPSTVSENWVEFVLEGDIQGEVDLRRARARIFDLAGGYHLLAGRDISDFEKVRKRLLAAMGWGLAATLALGALGALIVTRLVMRRLEIINSTSQDIMSGDLTRRIPLRGAGDEYDRLSANLNVMLDRIAALMEGIKRVSDNIAHDLKTPLARLRNQLELALAKKSDIEFQAQTLEQALNETDQLLSTFDALLRIARVETNQAKEAFTPVDLAVVLKDVIELYQPIAEDNNVRIDATLQEAQILGDRDLLFQAFANILDNAVKYSPPHREIDVRMENLAHPLDDVDGRDVVVKIADHGAGLNHNEYDKVTQRFYRADNARSTPGNGLGLSLVEAVAGAHDAKLLLQDNQPGLIVSVSFRPMTAENRDA